MNAIKLRFHQIHDPDAVPLGEPGRVTGQVGVGIKAEIVALATRKQPERTLATGPMWYAAEWLRERGYQWVPGSQGMWRRA